MIAVAAQASLIGFHVGRFDDTSSALMRLAQISSEICAA
jgi:hypothetical protein